MTKAIKPDMTIVFAEGGSVSEMDSNKLATGWSVEKPPCEQMNFIQNRQDNALKYILQMGIVEWDALTEYQPKSYVSYLNTVYVSLGVNKNKQPDINEINWSVAFDTYGSAESVQEQLTELIESDNPFSQYVLEDDPTFTSKAKGTSFSANAGLPTNNLSDVGHSYIDDGDTGWFKDPTTNENVCFQNGVEKLRVKTTTVIAEQSTAAVTHADLKSFFEQYVQIPVGEIFTTTVNYLNSSAVNSAKKYGSWERYAEGRALVGYSSDPTSSTPDWYKNGGSTFGEENVTLSNDQIPPHKHRLPISNTSNSVVMNEFTDITASPATYYHIPQDTLITDNGWGLKKDNFGAAGGGLPHNNIQPSIVVFVWKRIA